MSAEPEPEPVYDHLWTMSTHSGTASARVSGVPDHLTPKGRAPMRVQHINVTYHSVRDAGRISVELHGQRAEQVGQPAPTYKRSWPETFKRRIYPVVLDNQPRWLREFVDTHRPPSCSDDR